MLHSPLFELVNIVLTPHMAGNTAQTTLNMGLWALKNAVCIVRGEDKAHSPIGRRIVSVSEP